MKEGPVKPWSRVDDEIEEQLRAQPSVGGDGESVQSSSNTRGVQAHEVLSRLRRLRPKPLWALVPVCLATAWAIGAVAFQAEHLRLHLAISALLDAICVGMFLLAGGVRRCSEVRCGTAALGCVSAPGAGTDQPSEFGGDLQPIWQAVEQHTANIQKRLSEVLEEHSRMTLELSLAIAHKRQAGAILDAVSDAVLVIDGFDQLLLANTAAAELFEWKRPHCLRKPIAQLIPDETLASVLCEAREADARAAKRRVEYELKSRSFAVTLAPLPTEEADGDAGSAAHRLETGAARHGLVAVFRDVTRDREAARNKSEFVANAAHELRTPLSAIRAYVEMLVDGEAADEKTRAEYYDIIQSSTNRLGRMIDNILNISRIEAGTVRINRSPVAISMVVKEAADTLRPQAERKRITLTEELTPVVDRIDADRDLIQQAILNLISNAIKYTPEGGAVRVRMITQPDAGKVRIEVIDTGAGIPEADRPRMFEKFFRVEANKKIAAGTGLGLNLVKQIVETVHGGEVSLVSEVGQGSTFAITLPLYQETRIAVSDQ